MDWETILFQIMAAILVMLLVLSVAALVASLLAPNEDATQKILLLERLERMEYAFESGVTGLHYRLDSIEEKIYSYEDAMEAISLVLERNSGYYLYQELGVVVMSHDEYLRRGGD